MTLQTLPWRLHVAVSAPAHSSINEPLSYLAAHEVPPGTLVRVPLGRREVPGIVSRPYDDGIAIHVRLAWKGTLPPRVMKLLSAYQKRADEQNER